MQLVSTSIAHGNTKFPGEFLTTFPEQYLGNTTISFKRTELLLSINWFSFLLGKWREISSLENVLQALLSLTRGTTILKRSFKQNRGLSVSIKISQLSRNKEEEDDDEKMIPYNR